MKKWSAIFAFIISVFVQNLVLAQTKISVDNLQQLNTQQIELSKLSESSRNADDDLDRLAKNALFIKQLVIALKTPYSFEFGFDSLTNISILKPNDKTFRILTWSLPFGDETAKCYGAIQLATKDGSLKLIPLFDATNTLTGKKQITDSKNWYGARYFNLITVSATNQRNYYVLLGWKANNPNTNQKVIDVLSFENDKAVFGKAVFETPDKKNIQNRVIFEYNKRNTMTLLYDKTTNQLIFDHLAPIDADKKGMFEYYASDGTFDAYQIFHSKLRYLSDVKLKNKWTDADQQFIEPVKASELLKKSN